MGMMYNHWIFYYTSSIQQFSKKILQSSNQIVLFVLHVCSFAFGVLKLKSLGDNIVAPNTTWGHQNINQPSDSTISVIVRLASQVLTP